MTDLERELMIERDALAITLRLIVEFLATFLDKCHPNDLTTIHHEAKQWIARANTLCDNSDARAAMRGNYEDSH